MRGIFYQRDLIELEEQRIKRLNSLMTKVHTEQNIEELCLEKQHLLNVLRTISENVSELHLRLETTKGVVNDLKQGIQARLSWVNFKSNAYSKLSSTKEPRLKIDQGLLHVKNRILQLFDIFGISSGMVGKRPYSILNIPSSAKTPFIQILNIPVSSDGNYYRLPVDHLNTSVMWMSILVYWISTYSQILLPFPIQLMSCSKTLIRMRSLYPYQVIFNGSYLSLHETIEPSHDPKYYEYMLYYNEDDKSPFSWLIALSMLHYDVGYLVNCMTGRDFSSPELFRSALQNLVYLYRILSSDGTDIPRSQPSPNLLPQFSMVAKDTIDFYKKSTRDTNNMDSLSVLDDVDWNIVTSLENQDR
jgi:hypothetical protein